MMIADRIKTWKEIKKIVKENREKGLKIVFTNGCFDILHYGHVSYLDEAKSFGDLMIVGLNSDESVKRLKGPSRPINSELDRAFVLCGLKSVDFVVVFDEDTPYDLISLIMPDVLAKGGDWNLKQIVGSELILDDGGEVVSISFREGFSTTKLIEKINEEKKNGSR